MKIKVTGKDFIIFMIFSIFLLIFSSLGVLNVTSLLNDGELFGLNFFKGFFPPYLAPTLIVFFTVIIAIFFSVSSYIFSKDKGSKGLGITLGEKSSDGYSRWAKPNEIKKDSNVERIVIKDEVFNAAGIPLINNGKEMWVDNGEYHNLVIGATGSGKTTTVVDPMVFALTKHEESMILTDPKGELYRNHSENLRARGYKIVVLNFRNPNMGNAWNPLTLPYQLFKSGNVDKATELLDDVALNILYDPENKNDPFWEKSAADFFSGLALGLFEDAKEEEINLNSINYMSTVGEENFATSNYTKEYFQLKGENSNAYVFASNTINAPQETKGSILSVFRQKIRLFASREQLSEMLSYSDFNMRDIGTQKTAVFMIIHDEKTTYHSLATIFLKQVYETLVDVAQGSPKGKLPHRTNFILDEFANMPPLKDVTTMVTAARSRAIRFTFIIQNFAQLNDVYGKEQAETIRSNCGNLIYLITTELGALEEISKLCGEVKSKDSDKTSSTPLITVSDLQKLKLFEVIIIRSRLNPFRTKFTPSFNIDWGATGFGEGILIEREKRPIELFDIKEFVKVKKRNKLFESLDADKNKEVKPSPVSESFDFNKGIEDILNRKTEIKETAEEEDVEEENERITSFNPWNTTSAATLIDDEEKDTDKLTEEFNIKSIVENETQKQDNESKFDIDDLVRRIDAKIAELEAEEAAEKNNSNDNVNDIISEELLSDEVELLEEKEEIDSLDETLVESFDDFMNNQKEEVIEEPIVNIDKDSVVVSETTDDEYYDEFFSEDN